MSERFETPWYPDPEQIGALVNDLDKARDDWTSETLADGGFYSAISTVIRSLAKMVTTSPYLIQDWVWVASQLRIAHPGNEQAARTAWGGLTLLASLARGHDALSIESQSCIRWLTDKTLEDLIKSVGPKALDLYISPRELKLIEDMLLEFAEQPDDDINELVTDADRVASELSSMHHASYCPSVAAKLSSLASIARGQSEQGYWARAALRYVRCKQDVIDDAQGYLGLLDDIQVIEDVHELIHGRLSWRPMIARAVARWPMLARAYWVDDDVTSHLPPYLKAAVGCALDTTSIDLQPRLIVLPQVGPIGFLTATICCLAELRAIGSLEVPSVGSTIVFWEGHLPRYAIMESAYDTGAGVNLPMVQLRDGRRSVPMQYAALFHKSNAETPVLATSRQLDNWIATARLDVHLPAWVYRRPIERPSAMLITDRTKYFKAQKEIRPFGRRIDELIPVAHVARGGRTSAGAGMAVDVAALVVCSDLVAAEEFLRETSSAGKKLPSLLIVDRPIDVASVQSLLRHCNQYGNDTNLVVLTSIGYSHLIDGWESKASLWFLRPDDIDPIPVQGARRASQSEGNGSLARFVRRQNRASATPITTIVVPFAVVDTFASVAHIIRRRASSASSGNLETVAIASETLLRLISTYPPVHAEFRDERLLRAYETLLQHTGVHALFDNDVSQLHLAALAMRESLQGQNPKAVTMNQCVGQTNGVVHVLVSSRHVAETLTSEMDHSKLGRLNYLAIPDLMGTDDIETLIIPAWFGTHDMHHLRFGGWAERYVFMLYQHELRRVEAQDGRLVASIGRLWQRTQKSWLRLSEVHPEVGSPPKASDRGRRSELPAQQRNQEEAINGKREYLLEVDDWIEDAVRRQISVAQQQAEGSTWVDARLVFFDDNRHFGVFSQHASLICLNELVGEHINASTIGEQEAEALLWKNVTEIVSGDILAFPADPDYGDIIENVADGLIGDKGETRRVARLWRDAMTELAQACNWELSLIQDRLHAAGVDRHSSTIASWLFSSRTVVPKDPDESVPKILGCVRRGEMTRQAEDVLRAAGRIYRARRQAGRILVNQLSRVAISAGAEAAYVEVGDVRVRYLVLTVSSIDQPTKLASSALGLRLIGEESAGHAA